MIENVIAFFIVAILCFHSSKKRAIGWLVFCYYAVYIIIEFDYFGGFFAQSETSFDDSLRWYLVYTAISTIFFIASLLLYLHESTKSSLFYATWIMINMFVSGLSAIFQAYETNAMLYVYNVLQNSNLAVDIMVVILGTDTKVKGTQYVRDNADRVYTSIVSCISILIKKSDRF